MRRIDAKPDRLTIKCRVADRLGLSYGQFQAKCYAMYPLAKDPLMAYIEDPDNHADASPPVPVSIPTNSRVRTLRHCRWCSAELPVDTASYYCTPEHKHCMLLHKTAIYNRSTLIMRKLTEGDGDEASLRDELYGLHAGIRPGKPLALQCPAIVDSYRRAGSVKAARLLGMIKEE